MTGRHFAALTAIAVTILATTVSLRTQTLVSALPTTTAAPADNPTTPEKVALGRLLFWDPILSGDQDVACATCHHPDFGYAENRDLSIGVNGVGLGAARRFNDGNTIPLVKRNSQTIVNSAFNGMTPAGHYAPDQAPMFWDVRARSLEAQALEPLKALEEMRGHAYPAERAVESAAARVAANREYRTLFARAFGANVPIDGEQIARAIAAFERTLVSANSPFDRYVRGEKTAMTPLQIRGMQRFQTIGCANCHSGPMFSDYKTHVLGVPDNAQIAEPDAGVDRTYAFRTPSLRNVALTAPYMHSGVLRTLGDVVQFYDDVRGGGGRGGRGRNGTRNPNVGRDQLDPLLRQLNLGRGRQDLVAFLQALTDESYDRTIPARVPSGLEVGGRVSTVEK